ncbi:hypothetical protein LTR36_002430 [Oleoguttula mirabilis]|uniref:Uncharacterized protein n=1 Tax=Oleoguttula mirabilis TaxID=1507867 RepID=A0AAV9JLH5_9PEZI|nr:hypothetical protein LTR36_002430 [Oleoguttula mirabilis]
MALTRSGSTPNVPTTLRHPTPSVSSDGHSPYGSYSRSIMSLEQMAEEMSTGGSDIGEEIRRMNDESKQRSRQSSIQSSHQGDVNGVRGGGGAELGRIETTGSRTSSYGNSAVGLNGAARWGGYSPGGYISSPVGSVHSGSWPHAPTARKPSASGSSRLAQMVEPVQEGKPLDSPLASNSASYFDTQPSRQHSQSSFAQRYDRIADQIEQSLVHVPPSPPKHTIAMHTNGDGGHAARQFSGGVMPPDRPRSADTFQEAQVAFKDFDGVHFSPNAEEFVELDQNGDEVRRVSARSSAGMSMDAASLLRTPRVRPITYAEPPPGENMVYYPAPVPRMLNLPKRLSQLPAASVQAKRRSQVLSQLQPEARQSAPWLPQLDFADGADPSNRSHRSQNSGSQQSEHPRPILNERMSVRNLQNLPPQLRASIFFDHQSLQQDVDIKSDSAVATLDNILAASATAPASAFTDHPYAGDVRRSVYAPQSTAARRSTVIPGATTLADTADMKKRRSSTIGNLLRRSSSGDQLTEQLQKRGSRSSLLLDFNEGGKRLQKRKSQMTMAGELDEQAAPIRTPGNEVPEPDLASGLIEQDVGDAEVEMREREQRAANGSRLGTMVSGQRLDDGEQIADDFKEAEAQEDLEGEPVFAQPTTLLAELQVRKANLKSRNRSAVTAYPNGMHSTLLELDAVEEIQNKKRRQKRVPLAWEEPNMHTDEADLDDDVPLGVLYPGKQGMITGKRQVGDGKDWDRPLGLMEKRQLEDNEPLRSRRNRLQGLPPGFGRAPSPDRRPGLLPNASELHLAGQPDAPPEGQAEDGAEDDTAGETLGQRSRRLRTKDALDTTISEFAPKVGSRPASTFADDVLSQFGGLDVKEQPAGSTKDVVVAGAEKPVEAGAEEDETLGQRRARLQREREASGEQTTQTRPDMLRSSSSFANLLATNPVGAARRASREHKPAQGTLLHSSAQQQAKQKAQIFNTNVRSSSYGMDKALVDVGNGSRPHTARETGAGGLLSQQMKGMAAAGGFAGGMYNNGLGGIGSAAAQQGVQTSASTPMFGANGTNSYFASPTAFHAYGNHPAAKAYPQGMMGQPMASPLVYQQGFAGGAPMTGYGYPTMGGYAGGYGAHPMAYGNGMAGTMAPEEPLDPKQRDAIDQWRSRVGQ